ncbi:MAG: 2-octaprenyl-6-methoxyphenyl hydroxylase [Gammaproteobacteria bacterium]|nr:MAG: 2-octaprenyl-6-methoxyphenyl hydroxylase [Gammaproteobacteria bacterium]
MIDILIVGGGLVGYSLARALKDTGLSIHLVEARQSAEDRRPIALSLGSQRIFDAMGAWEGIAPHATPIREVHVSEQGGFGTSRLQARSFGLEALGYVVPAHAIHQALTRDLRVEIHQPAHLRALSRGRESMKAILSQGTNLEAKLVVGADGGDSSLRRMLAIPARERYFGQSALVGTLLPTLPHRHTAFERFTPHGPIALLPLPEGRCGFVWCTPHGESLLSLGEGELLRRFQEAFGWHLGRFRAIRALGCYPLRTIRALHQNRDRAVLLGNAAHTLHPVAAQGFNLALRDVHTLAGMIKAGDLRHPHLLKRYAEAREPDQRRTIALTEGLLRLFSNASLSLKVARNLGLLAFDLLPPAKRRLMRLGMGLQL